MSTKNMTQQIEKELRNAVEFLPVCYIIKNYLLIL